MLERSKQQQDALNQKKTEYENANLSVSNFCNQAFSVLTLFLLQALPLQVRLPGIRQYINNEGGNFGQSRRVRVKAFYTSVHILYINIYSVLEIVFSNLTVMIIRRNQILAVKRQIVPVIHFAVCFSVSPKIKIFAPSTLF